MGMSDENSNDPDFADEPRKVKIYNDPNPFVMYTSTDYSNWSDVTPKGCDYPKCDCQRTGKNDHHLDDVECKRMSSFFPIVDY